MNAILRTTAPPTTRSRSRWLSWRPSVPPVVRWFRSRRVRRPLVGCLLIGLLIGGVAFELETSWLQSRLLAAESRRLTFAVAPGAGGAILFPQTGPYDLRLGYARLPGWLIRLQRGGYDIAAQARSSNHLLQLARLGVFPIYREKTQTGLRILDRNGRELFAARYPARIYRRFDEIPPLVSRTLLFIEDRDLLKPRRRHRNPAVEWDRFALAVSSLGLHAIFSSHPVVGASTLATQLEKLRHSPGGLTSSARDKLRQMASASLRAYVDGEETSAARRRIVRDYINALPLAASPGSGEVIGLGDGLWSWWGADLAAVNHLLVADEATMPPSHLTDRATAYRQVLSLFLAINKPSKYLLRDPEALELRTDRYLHELARATVISTRLRDAALKARPELRSRAPAPPVVPFRQRKASDAVRVELVRLLGLDGVYELDRLDLAVSTTLDRDVGNRVTQVLQQLRNPSYAAAAGLRGEQLLDAGDPAALIYSVAIYERGVGANLLRVQADNYDQPLNISEGTKLELGSTAKLRTLITYLDIVSALHGELAEATPDELAARRAGAPDRLTTWAAGYLERAPSESLPNMLEAALTRRYSASPAEGFFTGAGLHHFQNFSAKDDARTLTVREAFRRSVNLVFVRLMRDVAQYYMFRVPDAAPAVLDDPADPRRAVYLARFADWEGREFIDRFYREYRDKSPTEAADALMQRARPTPQSLAATYRLVRPDETPVTFGAYLRDRLPDRALSSNTIARLDYRFSDKQLGLVERAQLSGLHPLELWVVAYLARREDASLEELIAHSAVERQETYRWLFRTTNKHAQERSIRTVLEIDAFRAVHRQWKRLGYPFASLVPSYATALGSSGDNPSALAELLGIIMNEGVRYPTVRISQVHFAEGTPYETVLDRRRTTGESVLAPAVAAAVRQELVRVVEGGTGRRAAGAITLDNGTTMQVAGKTGTGDNRFERYGPTGHLIESRARSRTAAFVFLIGDHLYGTVMAYVPGEAADDYRFTSALPVQVFRHLAPILLPLVERAEVQKRPTVERRLQPNGMVSPHGPP